MADAGPMHGPEELRLLELLREVQGLLAAALNSLGHKDCPTPEAAYLGRIAARTINRASEGYLVLRESHRVDASKFLVRPAIEAVFSATAAMNKPGFLFRKAYTEWEEDKKMFVRDGDAAGEAEANRQLEDLKRAYREEQPHHPIECKYVSVRETADLAGLLWMYEPTYRVYCKFTHGAVRAVEGHLDEATNPVDTRFMVTCVLAVLELLKKHTPACVPDLAPFLERLNVTFPPKPNP
jgi:Family of unknown function (DUF5677)